MSALFADDLNLHVAVAVTERCAAFVPESFRLIALPSPKSHSSDSFSVRQLVLVSTISPFKNATVVQRSRTDSRERTKSTKKSEDVWGE